MNRCCEQIDDFKGTGTLKTLQVLYTLKFNNKYTD